MHLLLRRAGQGVGRRPRRRRGRSTPCSTTARPSARARATSTTGRDSLCCASVAGGRGPLLLMTVDAPSATPIEVARRLARRRPCRFARPGRSELTPTSSAMSSPIGRTRRNRHGAPVDRAPSTTAPLPSVCRASVEVEQISSRAAGSCCCAVPHRPAPTAETELAYVGLGLHLGTPVSQDADGTLLGHVRDERRRAHRPRGSPLPHHRAPGLPHRRRRHHRPALPAPCQRAARADRQRCAVYNEILRRRPDLLDVLYEPMCWDRNGEESPGEDPVFRAAGAHRRRRQPRIFYIGWYIRDAQRHPDVPRLTDAQWRRWS